jgi:hypothetical protein
MSCKPLIKESHENDGRRVELWKTGSDCRRQRQALLCPVAFKFKCLALGTAMQKKPQTHSQSLLQHDACHHPRLEMAKRAARPGEARPKTGPDLLCQRA